MAIEITINKLTGDDIIDYQDTTGGFALSGTVTGVTKQKGQHTIMVKIGAIQYEAVADWGTGTWVLTLTTQDQIDVLLSNNVVIADVYLGGSSVATSGSHSYQVSNHQTVLAPISAWTIAEAADASGQDLAPITGVLSFSDADKGDILEGSIVGAPTILLNGAVVADATQAAALQAALATGKLSFTSAVTSTGGTQTMGYTYDAAAANLDFLRAGDELTVTYAVKVGDSAPQNLTITITGSNDAAVITGDTAKAVTEAKAADGGSISLVTGDLNIFDADNGGAAAVFTATTVAGRYGSLTIDAAGAWTYTLANDHAAVDALNTSSAPLTDTITVTAEDGTTKDIVITINGANDAAVITVSSAEDVAVTEKGGEVNGTAGDAIAGGKLTATDVDSSAAFLVQDALAKTYGTFSIAADGTWSYTLNDSNAAVQGLNTGDTLEETVTVGTADGTTKTISITITGANDAAVITGDTARAVAETDAVLKTGGTLLISDVDSPAAFVAQTDTAGTYGTFSIGTDGEWTYVATSAHDEFVKDETYTDSFDVFSADGTKTTVTVKITGTNDGPVPAAPVLSSTTVDENVAVGTVVGTLRASDVDGAVTYTLVDAQGNALDDELFEIEQALIDGKIVHQVTTKAALDYETVPAHDLRVKVSDGTADVFTDITITIADLNEAPTAVALLANTVAENAAGAVIGTLSTSDEDADDAFTYTVSDIRFEVVNGQLKLKADQALDFESEPTVGLTVTSTDAGGLAKQQAFTLTVTNVNEAPSNITVSGGAIREGAATGALVASLSGVDQDAGESFHYALLDNAGGRFALSGNKIVVADGLRLDHEQTTAHEVRVQVTDQSGFTFEKIFSVGVLDAASEALWGNAGANVLKGGANRDKFWGAGGNDALSGAGGADWLSGGAGRDLLTGGSGQDAFVFRDKLSASTNVDTITDFSVKDDTIQLENKVFTKLAKTGTLSKDNFVVLGSKAKDANDHVLYNKTKGYVYYDADGSGKGKAILFAKVKAGLTLTEKDFVVTNEKIVGTAGNDVLTGSVNRDSLSGEAGNDRLNGGASSDRLTGGTGQDAFVFKNMLNTRNVDTITDFSVKDDTIHLENKVFTKLTKTGSLSKSFYKIGSMAKDKNDYIVYDNKTGKLYYDADGSGSKAQVAIAVLSKDLKLTSSDFFIF